MTIESTLAPAAIRRPRIRIINCVRRLYQPDTRSIELLNQFSMFSLALATSLPAASIRVSKALFTCSGRILLSTTPFLRTVNRLPGCPGAGGAGGIAVSVIVTLDCGVGGVAPVAPDGAEAMPSGGLEIPSGGLATGGAP